MNGDAFTISEALRYGWGAFKRNLAISVGLGFTSLVVMFLLNGLTQASQRYATLSLGVTLLAQLVQVLFAFLWVRLALEVYDGRVIRPRDLLPDGATFLNYLAVSILYGLLVTAGLILLIVPGIYLAVRYGLVGFLVVDGRSPDVLSAFHQSAELTRGRRGRLFLFALVLTLMNLAGAVLLGIGLLVTLPLSAFASTLVYRHLAAHTAPDAYLTGPPAPMAV